MIRIALQTCLTVTALLISASVSSAAECADDPNERTLKKLCEVATTDGCNTIWFPESGLSKHVTVAQSLGMKCGITPIVDLCDTGLDSLRSVTKFSGGEDYDAFTQRGMANSIGQPVKIADCRNNFDVTRIGELKDEDLKRLNKYKKSLNILTR